MRVALVCLLATASCLSATENARSRAAEIVAQLQRADYAGDQAAMQKAYDELASLVGDHAVASRVHYWRGFAMWRRAVNGFNDAVAPNELEKDLHLALDEFRAALANDPSWAEPKIGMISCFGYLAFMDTARAQEFYAEAAPFSKEVKQAAPENPRFVWVLGPVYWNSPVERGGGEEKAIASYEKGLEFARAAKSNDPLEPSWGESELLMNLAWSHLNRQTPELDEAEHCARAALEKVPHWHYVRDILLPQISRARLAAK